MTSLDNISEFKSSPEIREKLLQIGALKTFTEGQLILNENAYIKSIPIVMSGSIKVIRSYDDGREIMLYYINAGDSCITALLGGIHNETSKVKAIAEEDCEILLIPVDKANLLTKEFPQWLNYIFQQYHKRFEELLDVVNAIAFQKVDERLFNLLKLKTDQTQSKTLYVTHEQLASELATARVVVSRLLKQMEERSILKLARNKITLM